jgi:hypothetical protein
MLIKPRRIKTNSNPIAMERYMMLYSLSALGLIGTF